MKIQHDLTSSVPSFTRLKTFCIKESIAFTFVRNLKFFT